MRSIPSTESLRGTLIVKEPGWPVLLLTKQFICSYNYVGTTPNTESAIGQRFHFRSSSKKSSHHKQQLYQMKPICTNMSTASGKSAKLLSLYQQSKARLLRLLKARTNIAAESWYICHFPRFRELRAGEATSKKCPMPRASRMPREPAPCPCSNEPKPSQSRVQIWHEGTTQLRADAQLLGFCNFKGGKKL